MAKRSKKNLLPKRLAGVKVPKSVRRGDLGAAIGSPAGQAVLAEVLLAAAAVAEAKKTEDGGAARDALSDVADRLRNAGEVKVAGETVTFAIGEAARAFVDAFDRRRASEEKEAAASGAEGRTQAPGAAETKSAAKTKKGPPSYEGAPR